MRGPRTQDGPQANDSAKKQLPSRPQNTLTWDRTTGRVTKRSHEVDAITAEAAWFEALNPDTDLAPTYYGSVTGDGWAAYELEYIPWGTASAALLSGWTNRDLTNFLDTLTPHLGRLHAPAPDTYTQDQRGKACTTVFLDKTVTRLHEWAPRAPRALWTSGVRVNGTLLPSLRHALELLPGLAEATGLLDSPEFRRIHGDLYPGNILYSAATRSIKVVDPRGSFGLPGPYGDPVYDLGKLAHTFIGGFDYLVAGRYQLAPDLSTLDLQLPQDHTRTFERWLRDAVVSYGVPLERVHVAHAFILLALPAQHAHDQQRARALAIRGLQALAPHL